MERGCSGVASEGVSERREVSVFKLRYQLIAECSVNVTTFVVLSMLFGVLTEEHVIVEGFFHAGMGGM